MTKSDFIFGFTLPSFCKRAYARGVPELSMSKIRILENPGSCQLLRFAAHCTVLNIGTKCIVCGL